jgi:uncharacterized membrane protein
MFHRSPFEGWIILTLAVHLIAGVLGILLLALAAVCYLLAGVFRVIADAAHAVGTPLARYSRRPVRLWWYVV